MRGYERRLPHFDAIGQPLFITFRLHAFVVMANHVHLLATSKIMTHRWLGPLKGYTGHAINLFFNRHGPVWQEESYDHLVRSRDSFERIRRYIELNPVRAGIVETPEDHPWPSAAHKHRPTHKVFSRTNNA